MGATKNQSSNIDDSRIGTSNIILISIRASLVGPFRKHFRFYMGVNLIMVIIVFRVVIGP